MNVQKAKEMALTLVGQGYIYGAKGQKCSPEFREKQAAQYPDQADHILGEGARWDGVPVWDCAQLTRAVAKAGGETLVSGATSQWNKTAWLQTGEVDAGTMPQGKMLFLFRRQTGSKTTMQHTGVALGDGTSVHARGTAYGVVMQKVEEYPWTHWAMIANDNEQQQESGGVYTATAKAPDGGSINVRKAASKNADRVTRVPSNSAVLVLSEQDGWCEVQYNGMQGWMMAQYLFRQTDEDKNTVSITLPRELAAALKAALENINL